jgi:hypothetical protein
MVSPPENERHRQFYDANDYYVLVGSTLAWYYCRDCSVWLDVSAANPAEREFFSDFADDCAAP